MQAGSGVLTPDEASFFLNIAVIGGTLLGLTFLALNFFLIDLLKRYEGTALPVFRERDQTESTRILRKMNPPDSLTDYELLDGDPLVIFMAFSVAVTWNLFLLPLTMGLTAAWGGVRLGVLAAEMCAFFGILTFSFWVRNVKIEELRPYLTREERAWPFLGGTGLVLYAAATAVVSIAALSGVLPAAARLAVWNRWDISNEHAAIFLVKAVCVVALLLGTYTANKDMFIFFKTVAAERMRQRWLHSFVRKTYPQLLRRVEDVRSRIPVEDRSADSLLQLWNGGYPELVSTHDAFRKADPQYLCSLWEETTNRRSGAASWMLDIPRIADWAADVEERLATYAA